MPSNKTAWQCLHFTEIGAVNLKHGSCSREYLEHLGDCLQTAIMLKNYLPGVYCTYI